MNIQDKIKKIIENDGYITVDRFMEVALFDQNDGYYIKDNPIGREKDFITSPEISPLFGQCLAGFLVVNIEKHLKNAPKINLVELGAGKGTLFKDILDTINNFPSIYQKINGCILDINPKLVEIQKKTLNKHINKIRWVNSMPELPDGPTLFICNEFFDALPVKQYIKDKNDIFERVIKENNGFFYDQIKATLPEQIEVDKESYKDSDIIEYSQESVDFTQAIARKIKDNKGMAIIIDYGHTHFAAGDTLQSIYKHKFNDIFENIGDADLTAHVNFRLIYATLKNAGLANIFVQEQGNFLRSLGIMERTNFIAQKISGEKEKNDLFMSTNRLIDNSGMGSLFKCLIVENF